MQRQYLVGHSRTAEARPGIRMSGTRKPMAENRIIRQAYQTIRKDGRIIEGHDEAGFFISNLFRSPFAGGANRHQGAEHRLDR